jgi:RNA polymerase sigma-54 factor
MEVHLQQRLEQRMQLSQQMLQNLELLQMPILALKEKIDQELEENPALELTQDQDEPAEPVKKEPEPDAVEERKREILESLDEEIQDSFRRKSRAAGAEDSDKKMEFLQNIGAGPGTLKDFLRGQVQLMELDETLRPYLEHLIDNTGDDGYLVDDIPTIAQSLPDELKKLPTETLARNLGAALHILQKLEPRGIGARTRRECLLLQLDDHDPAYSLKRRLIEKHLDDIANNRLPKIVRDVLNDPVALADFGYKPPGDPADILDDVKVLTAELTKLNPQPGSGYSGDTAPRVVPEVIIRQVDGKYEILLEDSYLPPITVNRGYQDMLKEGKLSKPERDYLRQKLDSGKKLISAIEQRRSTIQRITAEILKHQMDFFDQGLEHLRPLKMQEVADVVGIHVSTVSRAISEKWIETPRGIFPMKFFFAGAAPRQEQAVGALIAGTANESDDTTRLALMEKIRAIIDGEDAKNPLSDLEIGKILKQQGLAAARRTIAKYREELGIKSSRLRKQY